MLCSYLPTKDDEYSQHLLGTYFVPGNVLSIIHALFDLNLLAMLQ